MISNEELTDALRIFLHRFKRDKTYDGNAVEICGQIVDDCWNGTYYQTSAGHFSEFYVRDFAYSIESLMRKDNDIDNKNRIRVLKTLSYAMRCFEKAGRITTTIHNNGKAFDVYRIGPDSLALLLFSLMKCDAHHMVEKHKKLLESEIKRYENILLDKEKMLIRDIFVSSAKDHAIRKSSCYDNCMFALIGKMAEHFGLHIGFNWKDVKKSIKNTYWNGQYFIDEVGKSFVAGDANLYSFWSEVFTDKKMLKKAFNAIEQSQLDNPFPLKYTNFSKGNFVFPHRIFVPNYEGNTIWAQHGLNYIKVLISIDKEGAKKHLKKYAQIIEKYKNFLELYNPDGTKYTTPFYKSDDSIIWCANYIDLCERLKI